MRKMLQLVLKCLECGAITIIAELPWRATDNVNCGDLHPFACMNSHCKATGNRFEVSTQCVLRAERFLERIP